MVVHVGPIPEPDPLEDQLNYTYETRVGDIDADGQWDDILLRRSSGGVANNGAIDTIVLQRISDGSFQSIVPTATQLTLALSWPMALIDVSLEDINIDGFVDVFLANIDSFVSGALDQIVFAPAEILSNQPQGTRAFDSDLEQFIDEINAYQLNDHYFVENAELVEGGYWDWEVECEWIWWGDYPEWICTYYPVWVEYWYYSYEHFNPDAVDVWEAVENYEKGTGPYQAVWEIFEIIFGVKIGSDSFCDDIILELNDIENEDDCKGLSISAALEAVRRLIEQLAQEPDIQFGRETGLVYITAHRVFKIGPYHTAIEYRSPISGQYETQCKLPHNSMPNPAGAT